MADKSLVSRYKEEHRPLGYGEPVVVGGILGGVAGEMGRRLALDHLQQKSDVLHRIAMASDSIDNFIDETRPPKLNLKTKRRLNWIRGLGDKIDNIIDKARFPRMHLAKDIYPELSKTKDSLMRMRSRGGMARAVGGAALAGAGLGALVTGLRNYVRKDVLNRLKDVEEKVTDTADAIIGMNPLKKDEDRIVKVAFFKAIRRAARFIPDQIAKGHLKRLKDTRAYQQVESIKRHSDMAIHPKQKARALRRAGKKVKAEESYQAYQGARRMGQTAERAAVPVAAGVVGTGTLGWALGGSGSKKEQQRQYQYKMSSHHDYLIHGFQDYLEENL